MRPIPKKQRDEMAQKPFFQVCALAGGGWGTCAGRITWDHPLTFAGQQIIDENFTVPLCAKHHNVDEYQDAKTYDKQVSMWVALSRATYQELKKYTKAINYTFELSRLVSIYGYYREEEAISYWNSHKPVFKAAMRLPGPLTVRLSEEKRKKVQECIDFYADRIDMKFTTYEMVEKMIDAAHAALPTKTKS